MNVLVVEPGVAPYEKEINGLHEMQETVGGLITAIYPFEDLVGVVCNDEGILLNLDYNRSMPGGYGGVFGTFFVCGLGEEEFATLPPNLMEKYKKYFHRAEILLGANETGYVTLRVEPKKPPSMNGPEKKPPTPER